MKVEVVAEGTPWQWNKYTPDNCGVFFVSEALAKQWEDATKLRSEKIEKFYKRRDMRKLNEKIETIMELNDKAIKNLSKKVKEKQEQARKKGPMVEEKALEIRKKHQKEKPGCKCPWCRKAKAILEKRKLEKKAAKKKAEKK